MEAFKWGWAKFTENIGAVIVAIVAWLGAAIVIGGVGFVIYLVAQGLLTDSVNTGFGTIRSSPGFFGQLILTAILTLTYVLIITVPTYAIIKGALAVADGRELTTSEVFNFDHFWPFVLVSIVVALLTAVGFFLCFIPGLIVAYFLFFAQYRAADTGEGIGDALTASFEAMKNNFGQMILFWLLAYVAYFIGAILCGIGLLVAIPVVIFSTVYMYRTTSGQPVAAA
jgi:uncharacterized membrane protein